jgi:hypothetical protein
MTRGALSVCRGRRAIRPRIGRGGRGRGSPFTAMAPDPWLCACIGHTPFSRNERAQRMHRTRNEHATNTQRMDRPADSVAAGTQRSHVPPAQWGAAWASDGREPADGRTEEAGQGQEPESGARSVGSVGGADRLTLLSNWPVASWWAVGVSSILRSLSRPAARTQAAVQPQMVNHRLRRSGRAVRPPAGTDRRTAAHSLSVSSLSSPQKIGLGHVTHRQATRRPDRGRRGH